MEGSNQTSTVEGGSSSGSSLRGQQAEPSLPSKACGPVMRSGIRLDTVEWHSRIEKDWYAATVFVDLLTFIYVAIFYQVIPLSLSQALLGVTGIAPSPPLHFSQQHVLTISQSNHCVLLLSMLVKDTALAAAHPSHN